MTISSLGIRVAMPKDEQENIEKIGKYLGFNYRDFYKKENINERGYYRLSYEKRNEYINLAIELGKKYGIKYLHCDNYNYGIGDSAECCGTEFLRNHNIWGGCERIKSGGWKIEHTSKELGKVFVNFTRSKKYVNQTLEEVTKEKTIENDNYRKEKSDKTNNSLDWMLGDK